MSDDLEVLKQFIGDEPKPNQMPKPEIEDGPPGIDLEDLLVPGEDEPTPRSVQPSVDDIENLKFKLQAAENALDEVRAKLAAAEKAADELAFFRHPHFDKIKKHVKAGGEIYLTPIGLSKIGRDALWRAADQIKKIQADADNQKYIPIFDVRINNISTQQRISDGKR